MTIPFFYLPPGSTFVALLPTAKDFCWHWDFSRQVCDQLSDRVGAADCEGSAKHHLRNGTWSINPDSQNRLHFHPIFIFACYAFTASFTRGLPILRSNHEMRVTNVCCGIPVMPASSRRRPACLDRRQQCRASV